MGGGGEIVRKVGNPKIPTPKICMCLPSGWYMCTRWLGEIILYLDQGCQYIVIEDRVIGIVVEVVASVVLLWAVKLSNYVLVCLWWLLWR